ncbi:MAG: heavy metal translocating P-type ATPase metal-binding domain-containing protein [Cyclobacteriaceae bacterium]
MDKLRKPKTEVLSCYHCGEAVKPNAQILYDAYVFCCDGCKSVYQIINESNLCDFYELDEKVKTVNKTKGAELKYKALDLPEIAAEFIEFEHEGLSKANFFLPTIHCSSCIWLLEHISKINSAVVKSTVNFVTKEVTLMYYSDKLSLKALAVLLDTIGYPPAIELNKQKTQKSDLVIRLAVAGFFFGNSMLISIPEYLDFNYQLPTQFLELFGYLNLLFALPVFFYSSNVYFQSAWKGLKHKFVNIDVPISIGILTLFVRSLVDILLLDGGGYVDSLNGLVFFLLIGRWYQHKSYQALSFERDVSSFFPIAVSKLENGKEVVTKIESLDVGDHIVVHNQELIPADAVIEEGVGNIDYSFVTGESVPVSKQPGEQVFAGGRHLGTPITLTLNKSVDNSHLTKLWNQSDKGGGTLNNITDRISKYFTIVILGLAFLGGGIWLLIDPALSLNVFTSILIVACPCALALAVPFTYGHTMRLFGRSGMYLKNANVIESIAAAEKIVFDKTGTLSKPLPENVQYIGSRLTDAERMLVFSAVSSSIHPLSKLLASHLETGGRVDLSEFEELVGKGIYASTGDRYIRLGAAEWLNQPKVEQTAVFVEIDGVMMGRFEFHQTYREGAFDELQKLRQNHELYLLSGDNHVEKVRLDPYFNETRFNQTPEDKLNFVEGIGADADVMMVGDGLNDAGALQKSKVGISISDDVYMFSPASDAILQSESLSRFSNFLSFSKVAVRTVWIAFAISFSYNLVGLSFAFTGLLTPLVSSLLMPISSVSVVGFITLYINFKAKALSEKNVPNQVVGA